MDCSKSPLMHKHHVIPRYMGGTNDPQNLVEVTITQHAMFHYCNYQLWGNIEDKFAWLGLTGQVGKEEILSALIKENQPKAVEAARTPEARKKQKQKLNQIKHQQGEKNSQYGTMWIYNLELRENKKIPKNEKIPNNWNVGRIIDFDAYFKKQELKKEIKEERKNKTKEKQDKIKQEKIEFYTEWYKIYQQTNFKEFCIITGYSKSQQNLCSKFKQFVFDYKPKATNKKASGGS